MITQTESFWRAIEQTPDHYNPESNVILLGNSVGPAKELQTEMFNACKKVDNLVLDIVFYENTKKKILDLGAGTGANAIPLAGRGHLITAIEKHPTVFESLTNRCLQYDPEKQITLKYDDIETMDSYGEQYDLVIAVDVLPYLSPQNLQTTMTKIHSCLKDNGLLIGSIFTKDETTVGVDVMQQLGAHFYQKNVRFIQNFLKLSGFDFIVIQENEVGRFSFKAQKIAL